MAESGKRKGLSFDEDLIAEYMSSGEVLHLALQDDLGMFSVPVNYGYHDGKVYIHSSGRGRKIAALAHGGEIGFSVLLSHRIVEGDKPAKWGCAFKSVIGAGVPRILERSEKAAGLNIIMKHYSGCEFEYSDGDLNRTEVVEIMITSISARTVDRD